MLLTLAAAACASLPDVSDTNSAAVAGKSPTVASAKGRLPKAQAAELLKKRWARASRDLKVLAVLEEQATGVPLIAGNKVTLLFDGPATMKEMMAAVKAAKSTINLETYIFDEDEVGREFADLLIEKQKQGVIVNVLYDGVGNLGTSQEFFGRMRAAGVSLLAFNPVLPDARKGKWELNNRDHRKVMVVDGKVAFTGGINISSTYANSSFFRSRSKPDPSQKDKVGWRDTHVKVEGPAVSTLQWHFIDHWVNQEGGELREAEYFPRLQAAGNNLVRVLATDPDRDSEIYKSLIIALKEAKKSVHITMAYFVPDQQFIDTLCEAAKRGVDVQLVLPGVSDHDFVFHAGRSFYDRLLKDGVRIHELQVAVLHAKSAVIDGVWSTVGSANIDRRSFLHNYELNLVVIDPQFGREMEQAFNEDLRTSKEVTLEQWRKRPWRYRIRELGGRLIEYWL
jgi:cardiolipin synthase